MIGYHWSPQSRRDSIRKHGLLVPKKHPKLVEPVVCSEVHRNPHISLGKTPLKAWGLSGGFLAVRWNEQGESLYSMPKELWAWDLWEVQLGIDNASQRRGLHYRTNGYELQVTVDVPRRFTALVAHREIF